MGAAEVVLVVHPVLQSRLVLLEGDRLQQSAAVLVALDRGRLITHRPNTTINTGIAAISSIIR